MAEIDNNDEVIPGLYDMGFPIFEMPEVITPDYVEPIIPVKEVLKDLYTQKLSEIDAFVLGKEIDVTREYTRKEKRAKQCIADGNYDIFLDAAANANMTAKQLAELIVSIAEEKRTLEDNLILWLGDQRIRITALIELGVDADIRRELDKLRDFKLEDVMKDDNNE